eukprot:TRINITY_DN7157_c0_g2_i5.p1 TRINITY_DN7157_c0_g2~~TRINITY_DN7157_c0_g2_i5.p1  ORF type:complete len:111 (+),score=11.10 TRINITY_DN7157_c0_g2_i5:124-456(+)
MMSSPSTPPHISSSWSWLSPRRPRHDEEQGSFAELSDENDAIAIAIPIPLPTETEQQGASQIQGAAPQNSCNNYMPLNASELGSDIMSYAVPIILGVAQLLIGLHLFGVF